MPAHFNRGATFPESPDLSPDPLIDLLAQTNAKVEDFAISPDGKRIAYVSAQSGSYDLWLLNIDGSHNRRLVDSYPIQCFSPVWSPDSQWIAYSTRYDAPTGNIFKVRADGSEPPINLTYDNSPRLETMQWTPDGKDIIFLRPSPNGYAQLASISTEIPTGKIRVRHITDEEWGHANFQLSPDGQWFVFQSDRSGFIDTNHMDVWLVSTKGGAARNMTPDTEDSYDAQPCWSPDGQRIAFVSDRSGWRNIGVINVATGKTTMLTKSPWDEENPQWSPDGKWIAYTACKEWNFHIMKVSADGRGKPIQLTQGGGVNGGFKGRQVRGSQAWTPDSKEIIYTHMNWHRCNDLWAISVNGGEPRQITNHMPAELDQSMFVEPQLIKYKSKDGLEVPALFYRPQEARGKTPLLIYARSYCRSACHVNGFYPFVQYFLHKGYSVIAPQVRGSAGLGKEYEMLNFGDWGLGDIDDLAAGAEHLAAQGLVDIHKVVLQGGSNGGYFAAQTVVRYPDLLKATVCFYGPPDLIHWQNYGSASSRALAWDLVGGGRRGPEQAYDLWVERSPFHHIDKVKTPVLIMWGDRDGVRISLADDYFRALKEQGKYAEYILYNAEPHGWYDWRPETVADAIRRVEAHYRKFVEL